MDTNWTRTNRSKNKKVRQIHANWYARVSTFEQTLDLQHDALAKAGCGQVFTDTVSGSVVERAGLHDALLYLREGDTLVVWRLDGLGRSLKHLIETVTGLMTSY